MFRETFHCIDEQRFPATFARDLLSNETSVVFDRCQSMRLDMKTKFLKTFVADSTYHSLSSVRHRELMVEWIYDNQKALAESSSEDVRYL